MPRRPRRLLRRYAPHLLGAFLDLLDKGQTEGTAQNVEGTFRRHSLRLTSGGEADSYKVPDFPAELI